MNLRTFTTEELYDNIQLLLTSDNNYTHAIHRAFNILKDSGLPAGEMMLNQPSIAFNRDLK